MIHKLTVYEAHSPDPGEWGDAATTYSDSHSFTIWGKVKILNAAERSKVTDATQKISAVVETYFTNRINSKCKIIYDDVEYAVTAVIPDAQKLKCEIEMKQI